jgi:hypothetical protein
MNTPFDEIAHYSVGTHFIGVRLKDRVVLTCCKEYKTVNLLLG